MLVLFALVYLFSQNAYAQDGPVVDTTYGPVQGRTFLISPADVEVNAFHGIYYARAPVNELRFAAPQPPEPWTEVRDASQLGPACIQNDGGLFILTHPRWDFFSEDCLHLDVYGPTDTSNGPFPVMVWFHGGAYQSGSNIQYPGHFLALKDVVVVVPNYRLGNLGFMYTADAAAPGNAGMLDQVLSLEWVRDNVAAFGGDPNQVTIFGQSAGAASVGCHLMSPLSTGLFSGAIFESGSDLAIWAVNLPGSEPENYAYQVAEKLDCPTDDTTAMIDCLREVDALTLKNTRFNCTPGYFCLGMVPVVDGPGGFLPDTPTNLRSAGTYNEVPEIMMHLAQDGMIYAFAFLTDTPWNISDGFSRQEFEEILEYAVDTFLPLFNGTVPPKDLEKALDFMYAPWPYIYDSDLNRDQVGQIVTDVGFGLTADAQAKAHAFRNDVYHMVFEYRSEGFLRIIPDWLGVFHSMELPYVFGLPYLELNPDVRNDSGILIDPIRYNDFDREYYEFIADMWTNFAKTSNPTPTPVSPPSDWPEVTWGPISIDDASYLWVDNNVAEMRKDYRQTEFAFWREYLRCWVFGDTIALPGLTDCESPIPESRKSTKQNSPRRSHPPMSSSKMNDAFNQIIEELFSEDW